MLFTMLLGPTARASDSMFYPLTLCALQIDFMIMIMIQMCWANWPLHLFSVIFYCLAMRFCGCPYKTLLYEFQCVSLQIIFDAGKISNTRKITFQNVGQAPKFMGRVWRNSLNDPKSGPGVVSVARPKVEYFFQI